MIVAVAGGGQASKGLGTKFKKHLKVTQIKQRKTLEKRIVRKGEQKEKIGRIKIYKK